MDLFGFIWIKKKKKLNFFNFCDFGGLGGLIEFLKFVNPLKYQILNSKEIHALGFFSYNFASNKFEFFSKIFFLNISILNFYTQIQLYKIWLHPNLIFL